MSGHSTHSIGKVHCQKCMNQPVHLGMGSNMESFGSSDLIDMELLDPVRHDLVNYKRFISNCANALGIEVQRGTTFLENEVERMKCELQ